MSCCLPLPFWRKKKSPPIDDSEERENLLDDLENAIENDEQERELFTITPSKEEQDDFENWLTGDKQKK